MRCFVLFSIFIAFSFNGIGQTNAQITSVKLDSIIKADKITKLAVYFQTVDIDAKGKTTPKETFIEFFEEFKLDGHLLVLIDPDKEVRYYNLEKIIHWTIKKRDKILKLYFQI